jgi:hypothetical protein
LVGLVFSWFSLVLVIAAALLVGFATGAIGHTWRLLRVAMTLVRYDVLLPAEYYDRYPTSLQAAHTALSIFSKRRRGRSVGERLAKALERLGPAYVKVGQFLATRPACRPSRAPSRSTPSTPNSAARKNYSPAFPKRQPLPRSRKCTKASCRAKAWSRSR